MIAIGPLVPSDRARWQELFEGYNTFYERTLPAEIYDEKWQAFQEGKAIHALCARDEGIIVGIMHFFKHPSTSSQDVCYLQDLFTAPEARGRGVGRALIEAVAQWANQQDCCRLYWHTKESNETARRLYDQVAEKTPFVHYRIVL
ncbi:ribosomal protein S18 acetylase RimI-like enzyme [Lentzea atacamensis]|uniref:Ribosomal protein S18 acetylase RimI-like enzyme n=1 Tax=Lentzea atacamensis TaxID=531938 RepID=A0A316I910_9PSEU|nr:GNAT family N-acetyltransferase [Lentzea atacamensis]PWK89290.1 ribosomal protein S18 acetylase RimI-like enzyme [Lentzea atacamensis]